MTPAARPGELGIGDRVRFGGRDQTVIGVSGPVVRLADTGGQVVAVSVSGLLPAEGFAVLDARPRPAMPRVSGLDNLPAEVVREALRWQRHIVEVLRGVPPDAEEGTVPKPEYDPAVFSLTRREQAKAAELTAAGHPVTANAIARRRRRYQEQGLLGMIDGRGGKQMPPHGRAGDAVVAAMSQAISEAADESTRTAVFVFRRTRQILAEPGGEPAAMPSRRTLYRLFGRLQAGLDTTGLAKTRRSLAARPEGPFGQVAVTAPGDLMQIDSTPLDVLVRLDNGVPDRVDLTGIIDVATRTVTAAVLRPTTRSVDASVLLARTVTPEPMRPGWPEAMKMSASALPFRRMLSIDERLEHAAARPVIIPQVIVVDHGKVFVSESFKASCAFLGISLQPARKATGTDKPHIERTLGSVATMFAQYVSGYTGRSPEYRGRGIEKNAVWSLPELQDLLDQWLIADELHNLDMGTRAGAEASDTLKYFSERLPVTFVYAGIGLDRGALLAGPRGDQVAARFTLIPAAAFTPGQEWATLIAALEGILRLYRHTDGTLVALADYLHRRTRGMIGSLLWLIRDAACQAILDGTEKITRKSLDQIAVDMTAQAPPPRTGAPKR